MIKKLTLTALLLAIISASSMAAKPEKATKTTKRSTKEQLMGPGPVLMVDTAKIFNVTVPVLINEDVNPVIDINLKNTTSGAKISAVELEFGEGRQFVESATLYYTGTTSMFRSRTQSFALVDQFSYLGGGQTIYKNPAYAIKIAQSGAIEEKVNLMCDRKLFVGQNFFYVSLTLRKNTPLDATIDLKISKITLTGSNVVLTSNPNSINQWRPGISVRNAGDDGVYSYRIPALVTAKDGSLIAGYDVRNHSMQDLQEDIQIGISRSTDKGQSWKPMQRIMDMRGYGDLPDAQNGVGDPALLVDQKTGTIWAIAMWTHAMANDRAWWNARQGITIEGQSSQILLVNSQDNGLTWSQPINITEQVKSPNWYITLQGPGSGITMEDGTLVFAFQYVDSSRMPNATIIYSKDRGKTWKVGTPARTNTTEAQVVELASGQLMLNMRDNRGGSRAVLTTTDMGETWVEHSSSRGALRESVCQASLLKVEYQGKEILLFSNPDTTKGRSHITIKTSLDNGTTWNKGLLLDEEPNWGYSCLTLVDAQTIGILYESSRAQMIFQKIRLQDLVK